MFRLGHLSDPHLHLPAEPTLRQLASKRAVGYYNWTRNRRGVLNATSLGGLVADIHDQAPDHIAVTGDLVNIALPAELEPARVFLDALGSPDAVSVVPGNHDAYVPGALRRCTEIWAPYMTGDQQVGPVAFPFVRRREEVAIVGTSTARASAPFLATGVFSESQALLLSERLQELGEQGLFRVVLIHHPPVRGSTEWHKRLIGGSRFRAAIRAAGAELILHGHTHLATRMEIPGPHGDVPVIGVPSASQEPGGRNPPARWNLFEIDARSWAVTQIERGYTEPGSAPREIARHRLAIPRARRRAAQKPGIFSQA